MSPRIASEAPVARMSHRSRECAAAGDIRGPAYRYAHAGYRLIEREFGGFIPPPMFAD